MLPDFLIPHKHYAEETITGVLNGVVGPDDEDSETFPSETTMIRWLRWFITNLQNIDAIGGLHQTVLQSKTDAMRSERTKLIQL